MTTTAGFDLSYTATGIATPTYLGTYGTAPTDGADHIRAAEIAYHLAAFCHGIDLIAIEGAVNRSHNAMRGGILHGVVRHLLEPHADRIVIVPPATLKRFATGRGNAPKTEMVAAAIRRLDYTGHDDNEADALWLRHLAAHLTGDPLVDLPTSHLTALNKLELPR